MAGLGSCGGLVMGVREIDRFLEQWQIGVKDLRRRMILAPTPRERERWYAILCWPKVGRRRRRCSTESRESGKRNLVKGGVHRVPGHYYWQESRDSHITPP